MEEIYRGRLETKDCGEASERYGKIRRIFDREIDFNKSPDQPPDTTE